MDIVICMNQKDFCHKMSKDVYHCYWSMGRIPVKFFPECNNEPDHDVVFVLTNGCIVGFINPLEFNEGEVNGETIVWDGAADFTYIEPIPFKPFRGFRYRWFTWKLLSKGIGIK